MNRDLLRSLQAPVKSLYQTQPESGWMELTATGVVDFGRIGCSVPILANDGASIHAGLHPGAAGNGMMACSGELLLQALVTCAGTTLAAVSTSMGLAIESASVHAKGRMNFAGTMGVDRNAPVGLQAIELQVELKTSAGDGELTKLLELTERYCVVYQTLAKGVSVKSSFVARPSDKA